MKTIKIPFSGINRSIDDGMSADGQCMELINARIKNGMVEPIARPVVVGALPVDIDKLYWHANAKRYVGVNLTSGDLYSITEDFSSYVTITQRSGIKDVSFLGNALCVADGNGLEYALWNGKVYEFLGVAPELPGLTISHSCDVRDVIPDTTFLGGRKSSDLTTDEFKQTAEYNATGYLDSCIYDLNNDGYIVGSALIRYAFRTTSGDYIKTSAPILVEAPSSYDHSIEFSRTNIQSTALTTASPFGVINSEPNDATFKQRSYGFCALGMKIYISINAYDLSQWSPFITSIDVFVSPVIWNKKKQKKYINLIYDEYEFTDSEEETIRDSYTFHKVFEFDLKGNTVFELDDWSNDNLALQEKLVETTSVHTDSPKYMYIYNSRLNTANDTQKLYEGYGKEAYANNAGLTGPQNTSRSIYVFLNTETGISVVKNIISNMNNFTSCLLTYPDNRAYKMAIQWEEANEGITSIKVKEFELKKHPFLNLSYYFSSTTRGWYREQTEESYTKAFRIDITEGAATTFPGYSEQNTVIERPNVLKVSALNNPLSFPAAQTYQPSQGEIIGMQSNTTALSQGQFGQFPLYVFSSDGVYAMQVSTSGDVVYSAQTPVSRDVCINHNSIAGTDSAVVFASKRGLMAISGTTATLFSGKMDGYLPSCVNSSPIIIKVAAVAGFEDALSTATFNDYIEGASVAYNYQENELIVTNPDYPYAYVFNFNSGEWAKISPNPKLFVNRYPECYGVIDNVVYDMQNNHRSIATVLLLTKPIKMGTLAHKRILQSALRGIVKRSLSDLYLRGEPVLFRGESLDIFSDVGLYILGSNDAEHFTLVSGKESIVDIRDLVTKMNKSKAYKYFMVALAGGVRTDVSLNYMEFIASESFNNRLR